MQHTQPLFISKISSLVSITSASSTPTSPNSFSITATFLPWLPARSHTAWREGVVCVRSCGSRNRSSKCEHTRRPPAPVRMWLMSVVLPARGAGEQRVRSEGAATRSPAASAAPAPRSAPPVYRNPHHRPTGAQKARHHLQGGGGEAWESRTQLTGCLPRALGLRALPPGPHRNRDLRRSVCRHDRVAARTCTRDGPPRARVVCVCAGRCSTTVSTGRRARGAGTRLSKELGTSALAQRGKRRSPCRRCLAGRAQPAGASIQ